MKQQPEVCSNSSSTHRSGLGRPFSLSWRQGIVATTGLCWMNAFQKRGSNLVEFPHAIYRMGVVVTLSRACIIKTTGVPGAVPRKSPGPKATVLVASPTLKYWKLTLVLVRPLGPIDKRHSTCRNDRHSLNGFITSFHIAFAAAMNVNVAGRLRNGQVTSTARYLLHLKSTCSTLVMGNQQCQNEFVKTGTVVGCEGSHAQR